MNKRSYRSVTAANRDVLVDWSTRFMAELLPVIAKTCAGLLSRRATELQAPRGHETNPKVLEEEMRPRLQALLDQVINEPDPREAASLVWTNDEDSELMTDVILPAVDAAMARNRARYSGYGPRTIYYQVKKTDNLPWGMKWLRYLNELREILKGTQPV